MTPDERAHEAATLALNSAVEAADLPAAGGPCAHVEALTALMRTGQRLAALDRGERVPAFVGTGEAREVVVVVDGVRRAARRVEA